MKHRRDGWCIKTRRAHLSDALTSLGANLATADPNAIRLIDRATNRCVCGKCDTYVIRSSETGGTWSTWSTWSNMPGYWWQRAAWSIWQVETGCISAPGTIRWERNARGREKGWEEDWERYGELTEKGTERDWQRTDRDAHCQVHSRMRMTRWWLWLVGYNS